ncbi:MAG TPA: hypothetical protein VFG69_05815 [Nannocystaceae bacterium]|nr:hypothetical protein [Nannocystaceae bacterium]
MGWAQQWHALPSFLVGEYLFIALAIVALAHARSCGRAHVLAWIAALVAGTANDLFFMALPLVDNFWQAQATIMITRRLPLYIPCVYVCFMYLPWVAVRRLGLPALASAAATGLLAILFYAPYDIVGAKFLWWTWHDTDQPIANRILGAPIGSTMWVITFVTAWTGLLDRVVARDPAVAPRTFAKALGLVALASTPIMMVEIGLLQQLDGGIPGIRGLVVVLVAHVAVIAQGWRRRRPARDPPRADRWLRLALPLHFAALASIMAMFDPATHVSTGVHQTYGPCGVEARDITGHVRHEYLCERDLDEDFDFHCVDALPAAHTDWYTVCGRPHRSFATGMLAVAALGLAGGLAFAWLLRPPLRSGGR